jgi:hypothetical protein
METFFNQFGIIGYITILKIFLSAEKIHTFYEQRIKAQEIYFPDLYIVFFCSEKELLKRKNSDINRLRRNFEKHLSGHSCHVQYPMNVLFLRLAPLKKIYAVGLRIQRVAKNKVQYAQNRSIPTLYSIWFVSSAIIIRLYSLSQHYRTQTNYRLNEGIHQWFF